MEQRLARPIRNTIYDSMGTTTGWLGDDYPHNGPVNNDNGNSSSKADHDRRWELGITSEWRTWKPATIHDNWDIMKSLWIHCCPIKLLNLQRSFFVTPSPPPILRLFGGQRVMGKRTHRSAIFSQDDGTGNFKAHIFQDYTNSYEAQYSTGHTIPGVTQETAHDHDASFNFIRAPILLRYPISVTK